MLSKKSDDVDMQQKNAVQALSSQPQIHFFDRPRAGVDTRPAWPGVDCAGRPLCLPIRIIWTQSPRVAVTWMYQGNLDAVAFRCRGRPLCLPFFKAATGAIRMGRHRGLPLRATEISPRSCLPGYTGNAPRCENQFPRPPSGLYGPALFDEKSDFRAFH